jgi:hypothetical protein
MEIYVTIDHNLLQFAIFRNVGHPLNCKLFEYNLVLPGIAISDTLNVDIKSGAVK